MPIKQEVPRSPLRGRPITDLGFSWADRVAHAHRVSAELLTRLRRVAPSESVEIAHFSKLALTARDSAQAEACQAIASRLIQAHDEMPLHPEERLGAAVQDARIDLLETALEAISRAFAMAAPEAVSELVAAYRVRAEIAAPHGKTMFSAEIHREMAGRLEEAQRWAAPLPGEDSDA